MAKKNTQLYNVFEDNKRFDGYESKSNLPIQTYSLPNGINLEDNIDFISPNDILPHPENAKLFESDQETPERWQTFLQDIKENGIHDPLIVRISDMVILTGHRRHRAAIELQLDKMPVRYLTGELSESNTIKFMVRDNAQRRHWSQATWLEIYRKVYPDFDKLLLQENRGGNQYKKDKPYMEGLVQNNKLTAKQVAIETGQKKRTVEQQFNRMRKKLNKNNEQETKLLSSNKIKSNSPIISKNHIIFIQTALDSIRNKLAGTNQKTKNKAAKLVRNFSKELDSNV